MLVLYTGPDEAISPEIGRAVGGDRLTSGRVYDLEAEIADRAVYGSPHFERVTNLEKLTVDQLRDVARLRGVEGYSDASKDALVKLVRGSEPKPQAAPPAAPTTAEEG